MKAKAFVLCDAELDYAQQMAEFLRKDHTFPCEIIVCSSVKELERLQQQQDVELVLIAESLVGDTLPDCSKEQMMILNESGWIRFGEIQNIHKYQEADKVRCQILQTLAERKQSGYLVLQERGICRCEVFFSPIRRCLQTTTAITYSQILAEKSRVLYINMGCYESFEDQEENADLSSLLYYGNLSQGEFTLHMKAAEKRIGNWSYLVPMYNGTNIPEISLEEWRQVFNKCRAMPEYDVIVLDFNDAVQGGLEILLESDCIYMIEKQDLQSVKKREFFEKIVNKKNMNDILPKIIPLKIPVIRYLPEAMEEYSRGELADWVRKNMIMGEENGLSGMEKAASEQSSGKTGFYT